MSILQKPQGLLINFYTDNKQINQAIGKPIFQTAKKQYTLMPV